MPDQPFVPFDLERWQSTWEKRVRFNLSESGVHPLTIGGLLALADVDPKALLEMPMGYNQSDGTEELRRIIAARYPGATPDGVTVTVGSSEANFVVCWTLIRPGDRVVVVTPTYMQTHGLARNFGADVRELWLRPELNWQPDPKDIVRTITPDTRLVVVTNPNNPTGRLLSAEGREALLARVRETDAWLLADEVYQGAELNGVETPSFWGADHRVIVVNGLSKAYGLPGLRIGWIVSAPDRKAEFFRRHDYTVIGPSPATDFLAARALEVRDAILDRTRRILTANYPLLRQWLEDFGGRFTWQPPECGAIALVRYDHPLSALDLVERVRAEASILLVPGEHFELPSHLRLGYGNERAELDEALTALGATLRGIFR